MKNVFLLFLLFANGFELRLLYSSIVHYALKVGSFIRIDNR